ncbi:MAG: Ribonuclease Y [Microgenomates bacterium OLB23]|nr:MAG: Ribonuclease Y [Microgenomates bacterium OLB23]
MLASLPFLSKQQPATQTPIEKAEQKPQPKIDPRLEHRVEEAELQAKEVLIKAKEEAVRLKEEAERELQRSKRELHENERKIQQRESELNRLKQELENKEKAVEAERSELKARKDEILEKLEKVSKLNQQEAKELILKGWEEKLKPEIAKRIRQAEDKIKTESEKKSQDILLEAMRHGATDYVAEYTLSTIALPDDGIKGKIIGKEGRNIRAFELATGVDVDLEEEGAIRISSFDAYKREVAKVALERLIKDGRVQPVRIEEIVNQTRRDIDKIVHQAGEDLVHRVGVYDLPKELVWMLGKFKFRFSYGQNLLLHTLEETKIGIALAHELKADVMTVKLGCLFHDIGKVVEGKEGSHVDLGVELLKKYNMPAGAIHCVAASHEDIPFESAEAVIVYIADGISGGRPGARHEDFEQYLKRIKDLEDIATTHKGVREAYALQAGRELRVIVRPDDITEDEAVVLSEKIKDDINQKFPVFPGQVTITVIRETRAIATSHS